MIIGTSIGFKNIASKIAYDLRLWLGVKKTAIEDEVKITKKQNEMVPPKYLENKNFNEPETKQSNNNGNIQ